MIKNKAATHLTRTGTGAHPVRVRAVDGVGGAEGRGLIRAIGAVRHAVAQAGEVNALEGAWAGGLEERQVGERRGGKKEEEGVDCKNY